MILKYLALVSLTFLSCNLLNKDDEESGNNETSKMNLIWEIPYEFVGIGITTTPLILGDSLVIMSAGREVFAIDQTSGSIRWKYFVSSETNLQTDEFTTDGERIFATHVEDVRAINISDGSLAWKTMLPEGRGGLWEGTMAYHDKKIFVATRLVVYCIDAVSGGILWQSSVNTSGGLGNVIQYKNSIIVGGGYHVRDSTGLLIGSVGKLYFLDSQTGDTVWSHITSGDGWAYYPTIENHVLYVGNYFPFSKGGFEAIDLQTHKRLWKSEIGRYCISSVIVDDKVIALVSEYHIAAFDKNTGDVLWEKMILNDAETRKLHYYEGYIYHTHGWTLFVIDPADGEIVQTFKPKGRDLVTIAVGNGKVFVSGHPTLQCYETLKN